MPVPSKSDTLRVASAAPRELAGGRDKRVEASDRLPGTFAAAGDDRVVFRGCGIDRDDLVCEGREDLVGRRQCPSATAALPSCNADGEGATRCSHSVSERGRIAGVTTPTSSW
jgi:hypothetical protein